MEPDNPLSYVATMLLSTTNVSILYCSLPFLTSQDASITQRNPASCILLKQNSRKLLNDFIKLLQSPRLFLWFPIHLAFVHIV